MLVICNITTVYKAALSTVKDLYNLVTVTKYAVLTTLKILKITKKTSPIFLKNFFVTSFLKIFSKIGDFFVILRIFKVVRTAYFVTVFVTRLYKSLTLLKAALFTVAQIKKKFFQISKKFYKKFPKFYPIFTKCDAMNFQLYFSKFENCKIDIIFSKIFFKTIQHSTIL